MNRLENKVVMVTGATSGIGRVTAEMLANHGVSLVICGRSKHKMDDLLLSLKGKTDVYSDVFDVCDLEQAEQFVGEAILRFGRIDFLVNCAGANFARSPVSELSTEALQQMLQLNLISPFAVMQMVYQASMKKNKRGMIVNVLSTVCLFSNENIGAYTASKTGLDALTNVFRKEARSHGVKVCSIYPGGVDTNFREQERPDYLSASSVAESILFILNQDENARLDSLVIRPVCETNFV